MQTDNWATLFKIGLDYCTQSELDQATLKSALYEASINRIAIKVRLLSLTLRSYLINVDPPKNIKDRLFCKASVNISSWRKHSFMLKLTKQNA